MIVTAFLALVTPSFQGLIEGKAKREPRKAASIIRYLNDSAINSRQSHTLRIDLDGKRLLYKTPEGERSEGFETLVSVKTPSRGDVKEGELILLFGPFGHPEPFELDFTGGHVTYNPFSGRVKLYDGRGEGA